MLKKDELSNPDSCINKSADNEPVFVLCARDICAPAIIERWCRARITAGKNTMDDPQIVEAHQAAENMRRWRANYRPA